MRKNAHPKGRDLKCQLRVCLTKSIGITAAAGAVGSVPQDDSSAACQRAVLYSEVPFRLFREGSAEARHHDHHERQPMSEQRIMCRLCIKLRRELTNV